MHEVLFQKGPFVLTTYMALLVLGLVVSAFFLTRYVQFKKMALRFVVARFVGFVAVAALGGWMVYDIEHFRMLRDSPLSVLRFWESGLSPFGMLYAVAAYLFYGTRKDHEDFWGWSDALVVSGLVALVFVHLGHFMDGSDYGKPTDLPWGIAFNNFNIPYQTPLHPTQIYSALAAFASFAVAMLTARRTHLTGVVGMLGVMLYSLSALGIDFLHDQSSLYVKISHAGIAALAFVFYIHCTHRKLLSGNP